MRVRVGCRIGYESAIPTPMMLVLRPPQEYHHHIVEEGQTLTPQIPVSEYIDSFGNLIWRRKAEWRSRRCGGLSAPVRSVFWGAGLGVGPLQVN